MTQKVSNTTSALETEKLKAEVAKLQAEASALSTSPKLAAEIDRLQAESKKLLAEMEERIENAKKLRMDLVRVNETRILEWLKAVGSGAAMLLGIAALLTFALTARNTSLQRLDDALKRQDAEFTSAVERVSGPEASVRLSAIVNLSRFVRPGYEDYHSRALPVLVARLRFEPDFGIRQLIQQVAMEAGNAAKQALLTGRKDARLELLRQALLTGRKDARLELLNLSEGGLSNTAGQRRILQQAFFDASSVIAKLDAPPGQQQPLNLSEGLFDEFPLTRLELPRANLDYASFVKADLSYVNLQEASLKKAVLRLARLQQADLSGADLKDAELTCADVMGAHFTNVRNLAPEQLAYTNWRDADFDPIGRRNLETRYPEPQGSSAERAQYCDKVVN